MSTLLMGSILGSRAQELAACNTSSAGTTRARAITLLRVAARSDAGSASYSLLSESCSGAAQMTRDDTGWLS
jgi:hypothetical protein